MINNTFSTRISSTEFQDIIELQIEYKKRRPSQLYSELNHDVIAFTVDGYLVREF